MTTIVIHDDRDGKQYRVPVLTELLFGTMDAYLDNPRFTIMAVHVG